MSFDFKAVADAIAVRFGPTVVTAPSGETNVRLATAALPDAINVEPAVLVFPAEIDFGYGPSLRKAVARFPVRFYIYKIRDENRNSTLILKWMTALYATIGGQSDGAAHLTLSTYVNMAKMGNVVPGELIYPRDNGTRYHGLEWEVIVNLGEGMS